MPDLFMHIVQSKLHTVTSVDQRARDVVDAVNDFHAEIHQLEMMRSFYAVRAKDLAESSAREVDLAIRLRSAGAAVAYQDFVADLDYRINRMKEAQNKISVALGS